MAPIISPKEASFDCWISINSFFRSSASMTNSMNNGLNLKAIGNQRIDSLIALLNLTYNLFRYE
ncbi:MAG: hypothetical protein AB7S65_06970 [Sulfuricurvum sp.]